MCIAVRISGIASLRARNDIHIRLFDIEAKPLDMRYQAEPGDE
jgi:hypothetical protein